MIRRRKIDRFSGATGVLLIAVFSFLALGWWINYWLGNPARSGQVLYFAIANTLFAAGFAAFWNIARRRRVRKP